MIEIGIYNRNWRRKIGKRQLINELDWRFELHSEYMEFLQEVLILAKIYHWSLWGGGNENFAVTLYQCKRNGKSISIKMIGSDNYNYYASLKKEFNPRHIKINDYNFLVGKNMDEALKYLHNFLLENEYVPEYPSRIEKGGAYDRYPLEKKWAYEELAERTLKNKITN